ncbi:MULTISPECIES: hypothetical protein [Edwardsiella]|uniref:Phage protein n=1 Tax=Edwardsiella anguillarum TaxID=1821960 RepID=A0ABY8SLN7_9GAMM|nr:MULTISPECIES: hypothetical protein [Edwardsiella]AKR76984.1 hypothetical protein AAZ33_03880 [Edwardsiella sp. LADL05-105]WHP85728.1 hypothetical protein MQ095_03930 [Edwardsiella anguillarum]WHP89514.1 hypothetical protein MQ088_03930 [Edwardsiella anguillarum]WHP93315.1 hypothetical protein MQ091_03930 [Edwardsiella anguillarum]WHP97119.1 hypothetical protein MQ096_03930 [Edwardsiella anguillarum]
MAMKYSYFHHADCTTEQAEQLVAKYRERGIKTERSLNRDCVTWTVSALLPTYSKLPRVNNSWRNRVWG